MANMPYCRFQNTFSDLAECYREGFDDKNLSPDEQKGKEKLIDLCIDIALDYCDEIGRKVEEMR